MRCIRCNKFIIERRLSRKLTIEDKVEGIIGQYTFCMPCFNLLRESWKDWFTEFLN